MKALVLQEYNKFVLNNVPQPECGPDDVLIKVRACSICGSDVHGMDGSTGRRIPPIIMGHEASGVIEETGSQVKDFRKGDRVTFDSTIYCGTCYFCKRGEINLCDNRKVLGVSCSDYRQHGAFAEYIVVPQRILYPLPDTVTFRDAAMVEPLSIAFHAIRRSPVALGSSALVVGAGMIGLLLIQLLKLAGCSQIIAVDLIPQKLELAQKYGATSQLRADEAEVVAKIFELTQGRGVDIAFEVVGIEPTLQMAISGLKKGGTLTMVGNLAPEVKFPLQAAVTRQLTMNGSCSSAGEYPDCLSLLASGKVKMDDFISAVAPLEEGPQWFQRLYNKEPGLLKVILEP